MRPAAVMYLRSPQALAGAARKSLTSDQACAGAAAAFEFAVSAAVAADRAAHISAPAVTGAARYAAARTTGTAAVGTGDHAGFARRMARWIGLLSAPAQDAGQDRDNNDCYDDPRHAQDLLRIPFPELLSRLEICLAEDAGMYGSGDAAGDQIILDAFVP